MKPNFIQVEHFNNYNLNNVCIYLHNLQNNKILTLIEKRNNKIGVPGGRLKLNEKAWYGIQREYKEETGKKIPQIHIIRKYVMEYNNYKTGIYIATIKYDNNNYKLFNSKETYSVEYRDINKIDISKMRDAMKMSFEIVKKTIMTNKTLKIKNRNINKRSNCIIL